MNFRNTLFRCSSLAHIMTDGKSITEKQLQTLSELEAKPKRTDKQEETLQLLIAKRDAPPELSTGVITYLADVYSARQHKRRNDIANKYLQKGTLVEEDSLTLYSRIKKEFFKKNTERLFNSFIEGTPDFYTGLSIYSAERIKDIKSSWDDITFHRTIVKSLNEIYYWQMQGYMWLSGAEYADLCYCLVNTPAHLIDAEKRKLQWQLGIIDPIANDDYLEGCKEIERNCIFDIDTFIRQNPNYDFITSYEEWKDEGYDIPMNERLYEITIERDQLDIEKIPQRVEQCREWLIDFQFSRTFIAILAKYDENLTEKL